MKTFTYPKNKWAMTGALLMALGFSVSFNSHSKEGLASIDFSSEAPADDGAIKGKSSKIYTSKGAIPVKYIDNGEDKVLAIIPKKMTEGKVCDTCGFETIPLSTKNKEDLDSLNVALMKAIETKLKDKNEQTEKASKDTSDKDKDKDEEEKKDHFSKVRANCESQKGAEALTCFKDGFLKTLTNKKLAKEIEASDALSFYKKEIQSRIVSQISQMRKLRDRELRIALGQDNFFNSRIDDNFDSPAEIINDVTFVMEDLIRETPSKFESVRKSVLNAQTELLKQQAAIYKDASKKLENNSNLQYNPIILGNEVNMRAQELDRLYQNIMVGSNSAVSDAYSNDNINDTLHNQYMAFLREFDNKMRNAVYGKGDYLNGASGNNFDIAARLGAQQRGTVIVNPGNVSSGTLGGRTQQNSTLIPLAPRAPRQ